jgi:hypothetical protein
MKFELGESGSIDRGVTLVAIVVVALACFFALALPFRGTDGRGDGVNCRPPVFEFYRAEVKNSDYGKYDLNSIAGSIANIGGPTSVNHCQEPGSRRLFSALGGSVIAVAAVYLTRRMVRSELKDETT